MHKCVCMNVYSSAWCVFVYPIDNQVHIPNIEDTTAYTASVQYSDNDDDNDNNQQQKQLTPAVCIRDQPRAHTISSSSTDKVYACVLACVCVITLK